jgi:hypothetical protein
VQTPKSSRHANLPPAEAMEHARQVNVAAERTVLRASRLVEAAQLQRREREWWRHVWQGLDLDPDRVVACCACCGRIRTHEGEWGAIPAGVSKALYSMPSVTLSHGICPECEAVRYGELELSHR